MSSNSPALLFPEPGVASELRRQLRGETSVLLYGAGNIGRDSLVVLRNAGVLVRAFLDAKDQPGASVQGVPVLKPDDPVFTPEERRVTTVVVTIFNVYVDMPALHARLAALGWGRVIVFTAFYEAFAAELGNRFWLTSREYYRPLAAQLAGVRALWADEKSRVVFDGIVRFRLSGDYTNLEKPEFDTQYFPPDLPAWPRGLRLVDCGAYDGDTLRQVRSRGLSLEAYAGFEPDPANFAKLNHEVNVAPGWNSLLAALWPCGVWSHGCQLRFTSGHGSGSAVNAQGDSVIQCVALDEALPAFRPTLIKMDIEGAEHAALLGAARTIRADRPGLAICLYHEPAHLWQIPLLIAGWNLGYRFYLRSHSHSGFELVLYAVPA